MSRLLSSLRFRLIVGLSVVFLGLAAVVVPWTMRLARDHFLYAYQRANRDVARAVVEHERLFRSDGGVDRDALQGVFMKLMAVNPTLELYLLDAEGRILGYDAPEGAVSLETVPLEPIRRFLDGGDRLVLGADPRRPDRPAVFTAWPVSGEDGALGFVYGVLRHDSLDAATRWGWAGDLRHAGLGLVGILALAFLVASLLVAYLTGGVRRVRLAMEAFESGDHDVRLGGEGDDEVSRLARGFDYLADSVQRQIRRVERGDRLRREMIANVSHDLRTPLASLMGYLEMLADRWPELDEATRDRLLAVARRNGERVQRMTEDLFELSKLESGAVAPRPEPFPLGELVQDVVQRFEPEARRRGVRLVTDVEPDLPFAYADLAMIERVLGNLVSNALRHTASGGTVLLGVRAVDDGLEVRVSDDGEGIPREALPHVFERFYRGSPGRDVSEGSTGLGLAIVARILRLHRTTIQVRSRLGVGSSFRFRLPSPS